MQIVEEACLQGGKIKLTQKETLIRNGKNHECFQETQNRPLPSGSYILQHYYARKISLFIKISLGWVSIWTTKKT